MVIQTNEKEFKGKTLQEYLEWRYPAKEDKESVKKKTSFLVLSIIYLTIFFILSI